MSVFSRVADWFHGLSPSTRHVMGVVLTLALSAAGAPQGIQAVAGAIVSAVAPAPAGQAVPVLPAVPVVTVPALPSLPDLPAKGGGE